MASNYLECGSEALSELKNDLTNLSKTLHELYDLMNADMRQVGEAWRDGKYEEFVSGYRPQINKCEEISERYAEWCKRVLEPAIEECIEIEKTDVGGDGSGSSAGGSVSSGSSGSDAAPSSVDSRFAGFNGNPNQAKIERFRQGTEKVKEMARKKGQNPFDPGYQAPQNERPKLTPEQMAQLLRGRSR